MAGEHNCEESHKSIFSHCLSLQIIMANYRNVIKICVQDQISNILDVVVRPLATLTIGKIGADVGGQLRWG